MSYVHSSQFTQLAQYADYVDATVTALWFFPMDELESRALVMLGRDGERFTVRTVSWTRSGWTRSTDTHERTWDFDEGDCIVSTVPFLEARRAFDHHRQVWAG